MNEGNMFNLNEIREMNQEGAVNALKQAVKLRNSMGGALYYNIVNDDCISIAKICLSKGCPGQLIEDIGCGKIR